MVSEAIWAEIRCDHNEVSELLKIVNINLSEMIIVACFIDGYFVLSQMINITT